MRTASVLFLEMELFIKLLQTKISERIENLEAQAAEADRKPAQFATQWWRRQGEKGFLGDAGGGLSKLLQEGAVFEKAGVNVSSIAGTLTKPLAQLLHTASAPYRACGLSLVLHPRSPLIPTTHMNVRFFETDAGAAWFGGGADLTPYYPFPADFTHFHSELYKAVEAVMPGKYEAYKKRCDTYFWLPHRKEMRGVGGIFFDYQKAPLEAPFRLVKEVGEAFLPAYFPLVERRINLPYGPRERAFQEFRRGRYVEFNLLYDRGTAFGLKSGGRVESILMSLPPTTRFPSEAEAAFPAGGFEREMQQFYQPTDWLKKNQVG